MRSGCRDIIGRTLCIVYHASLHLRRIVRMYQFLQVNIVLYQSISCFLIPIIIQDKCKQKIDCTDDYIATQHLIYDRKIIQIIQFL